MRRTEDDSWDLASSVGASGGDDLRNGVAHQVLRRLFPRLNSEWHPPGGDPGHRELWSTSWTSRQSVKKMSADLRGSGWHVTGVPGDELFTRHGLQPPDRDGYDPLGEITYLSTTTLAL